MIIQLVKRWDAYRPHFVQVNTITKRYTCCPAGCLLEYRFKCTTNSVAVHFARKGGRTTSKQRAVRVTAALLTPRKLCGLTPFPGLGSRPAGAKRHA
jgi:hypothetical protein